MATATELSKVRETTPKAILPELCSFLLSCVKMLKMLCCDNFGLANDLNLWCPNSITVSLKC